MDFSVKLPTPLLEKALLLKILPEDISEQFVRGSGAGGQKINKTSSCVVLKHLPSGMEVRCQKHREQSKNRLSAYKLLILKIEEKILGAQSERMKKVHKIIKQQRKRSKRAKEKVLQAKKLQTEKKQSRKKISVKESS
jgi:protein subunit release factor B